MQAQDVLRQLRMPELDDVRQYVRALPTNALMGVGAFAAITTYWFATRPKALTPPCDLMQQSIEIPGDEHARRSVLNDSNDNMTHYYSDARTMYEVFMRGLRVSNDGPCLGSRKPNQPYEWLSYKEVADRAENLGSALLHRGHSHTGDKYVGIFSQNRPEVKQMELEVTFPVLCFSASISTVICDVSEKAALILDCVGGKKRSVKTIVVVEKFDSDLVTRGQQSGIEIMSLKEFEAMGEANHQNPVPPTPDDLALVCFTSGTTGNPKGAMLTHGNVISNTAAFIRITEVHCMLSLHDIHVSYLPLAHMFERVVQGVILIHGARIGYFQGDIRLLMDDLKTLQPTVFPVVPRLLNRMFDKVRGKETAYFVFRQSVHSHCDKLTSLFTKLPYSTVSSLGGHVRLIITGAAPVSPTILTFLRAALGCQFYEGYGQTECTAGCSMSMPGDWSAGHVGPPLPCNYIKLVDVAEMNYLAANGEGEVCVKGPNVFHGYLKDPEKTAEAIDQDGWLHTGDIGKWLPNGTLKLIDRKKHIFKLAQGEYIAPEKIETVYNRSDPVAQIFVHGDSLQAFLVAVVVPDPDFLPIWAKKKGFEGSYSELCSNQKAILEDILNLGKGAGLKSFEQVRDITLITEMFSVQNGLLTPTLKAKRTEIYKRFKEQLDQLYTRMKI
uniref:Long-chain-fatty-acid--CoA ligase n=1 Tax=Gouania willdenowi TaxID=441366 RepID=A0A8C5EJH1_GOUWI